MAASGILSQIDGELDDVDRLILDHTVNESVALAMCLARQKMTRRSSCLASKLLGKLDVRRHTTSFKTSHTGAELQHHPKISYVESICSAGGINRARSSANCCQEIIVRLGRQNSGYVLFDRN